jgi:hypothetical protein
MVLGAAPCPRARANTIAMSLSGPPTVSAGVWTYTYDIAMTTDSVLQSGSATPMGTRVTTVEGDYFAILDIPGYVVGSATNISLTTRGGGSWVETDQLLGYQPDDGVGVPDNASRWNANFQYVGTDNGGMGGQTLAGSSLPSDPSIAADGFLGLVSIRSSYRPSGSATQMYEGQDFNVGTMKDASNQSSVNGPDPSLVVPEPNTARLALLVGGAMVITVLRRHGAQA